MAGFPPEEREVLLRAHQVGPKMIAHLEAIGVRRLSDLARRDPAELRWAINAELGRPLINRMGEYALARAVEAARAHVGHE